MKQTNESTLDTQLHMEEEQDDHTYRSEHQGHQQQKEQDKEKERKQKTQTKQRLEPSLKWKALGLEEDQTS